MSDDFLGEQAMREITLYFKSTNNDTHSTTFIGEEIGGTSIERNVSRRGGWYRRSYKWTVYQLDTGAIMLYRGWREICTELWGGDIGHYPSLAELLSEIHKHVGREGPLAGLRKELLIQSLTTPPTTPPTTIPPVQ
jgi:hypothetical protein